MTDVIDDFIGAVEAGEVTAALFTDDAVLDATVPNWRFSVEGGDAVAAELGRWYDSSGAFETLIRTPFDRGEFVEWTRNWSEDGVPHSSHQLHRLEVLDGRVAADTVWCGGRWSASLLAEMAEAAAR